MALPDVTTGSPHAQAHNDERHAINDINTNKPDRSEVELITFTFMPGNVTDFNNAPLGKLWAAHTLAHGPADATVDGFVDTIVYSAGVTVQTYTEIGGVRTGIVHTRYAYGSPAVWTGWSTSVLDLSTPWAQLSLTGNSGMTAYGGVNPVFRRDSAGNVSIIGRVALGSTLPPATTVLATLPSGFRLPPNYDAGTGSDYLVPAGNLPASFRLFPNGNIAYIWGGTPSTWLSLNITFPTLGGS